MDSEMEAGVLGGIADGIGQAAKNLYTIRQAKRSMDMKQQELDNETSYKHAQIDYLEGKGQLANQQAEGYRFLIDRADKQKQKQLDVQSDQIDNAHVQVQQQGSQYRQILQQALQGQAQQEQTQTGDGSSAETDQVDQGSPVVNTIMPGVGAQQQPPVIPTGNQAMSKQLNQAGGAGTKSPFAHRNASLQKAMGQINAMQIDNKEDAGYALDKYYGADWRQNPDALKFLNDKFGGQGGGNAPAGNTGAPGGPDNSQPASSGSAGDMVSVTAPDGTPYKLPRANLQKALSRGYKVRG